MRLNQHEVRLKQTSKQTSQPGGLWRGGWPDWTRVQIGELGEWGPGGGPVESRGQIGSWEGGIRW